MKDNCWEMEGCMGPPVQVQNHQTNATLGDVGVGFTIRYVQEYEPRLSAFEVARTLNNVVWERAKIENDRARKEDD